MTLAAERPRSSRARLSVLVVDDSALVRQVFGTILASAADIEVEVAANPLIALHKIARKRPDVIVLDLHMPKMSGLHFLEQLMPRDPIPVVVCSGVAARGSELALDALRAGAIEILAKPDLTSGGEEVGVLLLDAIRAAARASVQTALRISERSRRPPAPAARTEPCERPAHVLRRPLIALGASTGGTEALRLVLAGLPRSTPGIVVVQHMPAPFTRAFADGLAGCCEIDVREATDGEPVRAGLALIAPGGRHMRVLAVADGYVVRLSDGPLVSRHRPSVDVLFRSVAQAASADGIGVLMTGMGDDGAEGLLSMREAGAMTIAQDEATSVVFGMPKEAIARGAAHSVLPLERIGAAVVSAAMQRRVAPVGAMRRGAP